jgi:hypothetical protein
VPPVDRGCFQLEATRQAQKQTKLGADCHLIVIIKTSILLVQRIFLGTCTPLVLAFTELGVCRQTELSKLFYSVNSQIPIFNGLSQHILSKTYFRTHFSLTYFKQFFFNKFARLVVVEQSERIKLSRITCNFSSILFSFSASIR